MNATVKEKGITDRGRKAFGKFLDDSMRGMSREAFAAWLTDTTGIPVGRSQIQTLAAASWSRNISPQTLVAICESKILQYPDGRFFTIQDCFLVMQEKVNPWTGELQDPVEAPPLNRQAA